MDPLVEVVRDTVGRHDTFALACQAKYYEDLGYPGHVNCTDNFNGALRAVRRSPRARAGRRSTSSTTPRLTRNMQLISDEPWSRPGDYVMLRAMNDLVCASSACPDDIDPSNAWEVTDVHVRVYSPENRFSMAIARRVTADAEPVLTRETAFHSAHLGADQELRRVPRLLAAALLQQRGRDRRVLGLPRAPGGDGPLAAAQVGGARPRCRDADAAARHPQRPQAVGRPGRLHGALQRDRRDDRRRDRVPPRRRTTSASSAATSTTASGCARSPTAWASRRWIKPSTDQLHNIAVQGPLSREALAEFVWTPPSQPCLEELKWFRFLVGRIGAYDGMPIVVSRHRLHRRARATRSSATPPTARPSGTRSGRPASRAAMQAARARGARHPADRVRADLRRLRVRRPGRSVRGRDRLRGGARTTRTSSAATRCSSATSTRSAGWSASSSTATRSPATATRSTSAAGASASSPAARAARRCEASIALCRMAVQYAELGTEVEVGKLDGLQKRIPATVVRFPFYDPEKKRPRS